MIRIDVIGERLKTLPEYPFARIDRLKKEIPKERLIDLGIGDPDLPTAYLDL